MSSSGQLPSWKDMLSEEDLANPFMQQFFPQLEALEAEQRRNPKKAEPWTDEEDETDSKEKAEQEWDAYKQLTNSAIEGKMQYSRSITGSVTKSNLSDIEVESLTSSLVTHLTATSSASKTPNLKEQYDFSKTNRDPLPVDKWREKIVSCVESNTIVVLSGNTGCGKTTQVPQFILEDCAEKKIPVNIIVTQPRKIAAKSVAQRVCAERGWPLGGITGYHVGLDKMNKSPDTKLLYVTTGVLKHMLINNPDTLKTYTHIIMDEVHERELDVDFILAYLKKVINTTETKVIKFKLILMSATINETKFRDYFGSRIDGCKIPAPYLNIGYMGKETNLEVKEYFLGNMGSTKDEQDLFSIHEPVLHDVAIETCIKMMKENLKKLDEGFDEDKPGSVLIFLPGVREIEVMEKALRSRIISSDGAPLEIIILHSRVPFEDHMRIFEDFGPNKRKVILSTNVAESSLTLKDIVYVFDFCLTKNIMVDSDTGYESLKLCWASQQQLKQRKGRTGRVGRGIVFHIVPERLAKAFSEEQPPEMARVPLTKLILEIKLCNFGSPKEMLAICMEPPKKADIDTAILNLKMLGALLPTVSDKISHEDGDITVLGEIIAKLPIDVCLGKLVVFGHIFGILNECIIIAAGLNGKSIFSISNNKKLQSYGHKLVWSAHSRSDCIAILNAYNEWDSREVTGTFRGNGEEVFCNTYYLERKQLHETRQLVHDITETLSSLGIMAENPIGGVPPTAQNGLKSDLLRDIVLFGAFYPNYFIKYYNEDREQQANRELHGNDPLTSVVYEKFPEEHVKFEQLYKTQVKQLLTEVKPQITKIKFVHSKIIVTFARDVMKRLPRLDEENQESQNHFTENFVPPALLMALKKGKIKGTKANLMLYNEMDAQKCLERMHDSSDRDDKLKVKPQEAPKLTDEAIEFQVTNVHSPNSFWIVPLNYKEAEDDLYNVLHDNFSLCPSLAHPNLAKIGEVYLTLSDPKDEFSYSRVKVEEKASNSEVKVFFFDTGLYAKRPAIQLRKISGDLQAFLLGFPALAVECSLAGLQPVQNTTNISFWSENSVREFHGLLDEAANSERPCKADIFSDIPSNKGINKFVLKLNNLEVYNRHGQLVNVNSWLLKNGLAEKQAENYASMMNAKQRSEYDYQNDMMKESLDNRYKEEYEIPLEDKEVLKMADMVITLRGPYSPLQTQVTSVNKARTGARVTINEESVNSIILDAKPTEQHHVWMVADKMSVAAQSGNLNVRSTNWLPNRPGIGPACVAMFAPRVQFRANESQTLYTGCLVGLGCEEEYTLKSRKRVWKSLHPSQDMEIRFDTRMGKDEVFLLNGIRHSLSEVLDRGPEGAWRMKQVKFLHDCRQSILAHMSILLSKDMPYKDTERMHHITEDFKWRGGLNTNYSQIYRRIDRPNLKDPFQLLEEYINAAKAVGVDMSDEAYAKTMYCPVCSKIVESPQALLNHVKTPSHLDAAKRLRTFV